jgi:hypothetical protein
LNLINSLQPEKGSILTLVGTGDFCQLPKKMVGIRGVEPSEKQKRLQKKESFIC